MSQKKANRHKSQSEVNSGIPCIFSSKLPIPVRINPDLYNLFPKHLFTATLDLFNDLNSPRNRLKRVWVARCCSCHWGAHFKLVSQLQSRQAVHMCVKHRSQIVPCLVHWLLGPVWGILVWHYSIKVILFEGFRNLEHDKSQQSNSRSWRSHNPKLKIRGSQAGHQWRKERRPREGGKS